MEPLSSPPTKKRRPNFSEEELLMLTAEVSKRKALLLGPLTNSVTLRSKDRAWETVAVAVGGVGRVKREKGEVRKKFKDFRSEVKKKAAKINKERKKTGGGSLDVNDQLKASEEAMWSLLELEAIDGLANIEDSEELSSMASATIENEEPAPPRTTSVAACKHLRRLIPSQEPPPRGWPWLSCIQYLGMQTYSWSLLLVLQPSEK
ncbi:myb/SANT-like DNA-binding domain-containing protein 4 [Eriocheir sinensis]|uniref:myb/SANT-like DNA-binding domain-containing protein 4 n=1 Tax=Eriocheir sinensis TaxID=95602 RepID=UPI0021C6FDD0|nr:myb/SANT-like DNA-binding domain-containing protein 4 [Eriocheir sinensis]